MGKNLNLVSLMWYEVVNFREGMRTHDLLDLAWAQPSMPDLVCGFEGGYKDVSNVLQSYLRSGE